MSAINPPTDVSAPADRFPSLVALLDAHADLLQRHESDGSSPTILAEIDHFIARGRATGALLDARTDRRAAQVLLDYWIATLAGLGSEPPTGILDPFDPSLAPDLPDALCPYVGLNAFHEDDRDRFFGRQQLIEDWITRLATQRLLIVTGPSGSGKSSLVQGGLLPELKRGALPGSQHWRYLPPLLPGASPLTALARLVLPSTGPALDQLSQEAAQFLADSSHLSQRLAGQPPILLVVDQFEELFTLCLDERQRAAFAANLVALVDAPDARHTVILTMRSDFEDRIPKLPLLAARFEAARIHATPLNADQLRSAIQGPADRIGLKFEEGVVDQLISEILGEPAGLPLLQFALLKLWEAREHNRITWQAYRRLGDARKALATSADAFYSGLIEENKQTCRRILLQMVRLGQDFEPTSRRIQRRQLYAAGEARDRIDQVVARLVAAHLIRLTPGDRPDDEQIEVAHESLVRNWPRLTGWLEDERADLRKRQRLTDAASQWQEDPSRAPLWSRSLVEEAARYDNLSTAERAFLTASRDAADAAQRERERAYRRMGVGVVVLSLLVVALLAMSVFAWQQYRKAQQESNRTLSEVIASNALRVLPNDPELSVLLARAAFRSAATPQALDALRQALAAYPGRGALRPPGNASPVTTLALSPDGRLIAAGYKDGTARIWSLQTHRAIASVSLHAGRRLGQAILSAAWVEPGIILALADGSLRLWAVDQHPSPIRTLLPGGQPVQTAVLSTDGRRLAAVGDRVVRRWSLNVTARTVTVRPDVSVPTTRTDPVTHLVFSPDDRLLLTVSARGSMAVWALHPARAAEPIRPITQLTAYGVTLAAFAPDSRSVVLALPGNALLCAVATPCYHSRSLIGLLPQRPKSVDNSPPFAPPATVSLAFSPDGSLLAAAQDGTARVLRLADGKIVETLLGRKDAMTTAMFAPDGRSLITGTATGTIRIWALPAGSVSTALKMPGRPLSVYRALFAGADRFVVVGDYAGLQPPGEVGIFDARSGRLLRSLHDIIDFDVSHDGRSIVTVERSQIAIRRPDGRLLHTFHSTSGEPLSYAYLSPDHTLLVALSSRRVKIWNARTGRLLHTFLGVGAFAPVTNQQGMRIAIPGSPAAVWAAAPPYQRITTLRGSGSVAILNFSPDGRRLVAVTAAGTAGVWDARTGRELHPLLGQTGAVFWASYSPNGKWIATASADTTAGIWNANTGQLVHILAGHTGPVYRVYFSPDNQQVLTTSLDHTARLWSTVSGAQLALLDQQHGTVARASFNARTTAVVTASLDGLARIYPIPPCGICRPGPQLVTLADQWVTRDLTPRERAAYTR